jgi:hypothetical protein
LGSETAEQSAEHKQATADHKKQLSLYKMQMHESTGSAAAAAATAANAAGDVQPTAASQSTELPSKFR